jgi:hypothetical protein
LSHEKSATFTSDKGIFVANTAGFRSGAAAVHAATSKKNLKRKKVKYYPDNADGEVAAQNASRKKSSKTDDVRQRNSEGRKDRVSTQPHHKTHLSKSEEAEARAEFKKRKRERDKES